MQLKTIEDLYKFKLSGKKRVPTGEPNMYEIIYQYTPEEIAPFFNFVEKILGEGYYRDGGARNNKRAEMIADTHKVNPRDPRKPSYYQVSEELWKELTS